MHRAPAPIIAVLLVLGACRPAPEDGAATLELARRYSMGGGVARDATRAAALYERACVLGQAQGCLHAGMARLLGEGVARDAERATALLEKACAGGDYQGCTQLGILHRAGEVVPLAPGRAVRLFERACVELRGGAEPCNLAAAMYETGEGIPADAAKAAALGRLSCELGDERQCGPGEAPGVTAHAAPPARPGRVPAGRAGP